MKTKASLPEILLAPSTTLKVAMDRLGESPFNIVFGVDENQKLVGCITDGDVRRALLSGETLETPIDRIMRKNFISAPVGTPHPTILNMLLKNGVRQIPLLDKEGRVAEVKVLENFVAEKKFNLPVVVMAGGKGTRLRPFTENTPKPLLKIGETTVIERLLTSLISAGTTDFYVTVNYLAQQVEDHLGDGSRLGARISYVRETQALGTAGSLSLLSDKITTDFLVVNGDMLTNVDFRLFQQFHQEHGAVATVCSKYISIKVPFGVLKLDGADLVAIEEKPDLALTVSSGIYMMSPEVFNYVDGQHIDMPQLIGRLIADKKRVVCFQSMEPWIDIGSHEDFERAQKYLEYLNW